MWFSLVAMSDSSDISVSYSGSRRRFLRQSFAFSALAAMGSVRGIADSMSAGLSGVGADVAGAELLMIGDWGYEEAKAQSKVASAMAAYTKANTLHWQALMLLGDNWYGPLPGGAQSTRWQTQFEEMYPASVFDCPAYAILGNHDYQNMPVSKVDAELEYARTARPGGKATRFIMPSRWYRFEFPAKDPLITFVALDSNMPKEKKNDVDFTLTEQDAATQLAWLEGRAEEAADDAVSGGDGASPGVFGWTAWGPSGVDQGLGPAVSEVQRDGVSGGTRSRSAAFGVCGTSDELLFVGWRRGGPLQLEG